MATLTIGDNIWTAGLLSWHHLNIGLADVKFHRTVGYVERQIRQELFMIFRHTLPIMFLFPLVFRTCPNTCRLIVCRHGTLQRSLQQPSNL